MGTPSYMAPEQALRSHDVDVRADLPEFVADTRAKRLDGEFNRAYRYLEILFDGRNPYMESIEQIGRAHV